MTIWPKIATGTVVVFCTCAGLLFGRMLDLVALLFTGIPPGLAVATYVGTIAGAFIGLRFTADRHRLWHVRRNWLDKALGQTLSSIGGACFYLLLLSLVAIYVFHCDGEESDGLLIPTLFGTPPFFVLGLVLGVKHG